MNASPETSPLRGLRLLIPRAPERADPLRRKIEALGGEARCVPALDIVPTATADDVRRRHREAGAADVAIFTSVNAVDRWFALGDSPPALPEQVFGVGAATVAALAGHGVRAVAPARHDSEGLIAEPAIRHAATVLLLTGEGGRQTLRDALGRSGRLIDIPLYRRRAHPGLRQALTAVVDWANAVVASSAQTYSALVDADPLIGATLLRYPVVAPSERVIKHIRTLGSNAPAWLAAPFGDAAVLNALRAHWVPQPNQRARDDD